MLFISKYNELINESHRIKYKIEDVFIYVKVKLLMLSEMNNLRISSHIIMY